ncbi:uncharacterized protein dipk2b [Diretmus argenteus]
MAAKPQLFMMKMKMKTKTGHQGISLPEALVLGCTASHAGVRLGLSGREEWEGTVGLGSLEGASPSAQQKTHSLRRAYLGLDKCNACVGTSMCKKLFKDHETMASLGFLPDPPSPSGPDEDVFSCLGQGASSCKFGTATGQLSSNVTLLLRTCADPSQPDWRIHWAVQALKDSLRPLRPCSQHYAYRYPECRYDQRY